MKGFIDLINDENFQVMFIVVAALTYMLLDNIFGHR